MGAKVRLTGSIPVAPALFEKGLKPRIREVCNMKDKMVTRTITTTKATVLVANPEAGSCQPIEVVVAGAPKTQAALYKLVSAAVPAPYVFVAIQSTEREEKLYGMAESAFIANAEVLPPRSYGYSVEVN